MLSSDKFVGGTEACFKDFINKHPGLEAIELIGEFCCEGEPPNKTARVQRWQRGEYFPVGIELLKLRCFLHLAGYEVTELMRLKAEMRELVFTVSLGEKSPGKKLDPLVINRSLGYRNRGTKPGGLLRILVHGKGYLPKIKEKAEEINSRHRKKVSKSMAAWKERIYAVVGDVAIIQSQPAGEEHFSADMIATIFARNVAAATAAGQMLLAANAEDAALAATRGGLDLQELREILGRFS